MAIKKFFWDFFGGILKVLEQLDVVESVTNERFQDFVNLGEFRSLAPGGVFSFRYFRMELDKHIGILKDINRITTFICHLDLLKKKNPCQTMFGKGQFFDNSPSYFATRGKGCMLWEPAEPRLNITHPDPLVKSFGEKNIKILSEFHIDIIGIKRMARRKWGVPCIG